MNGILRLSSVAKEATAVPSGARVVIDAGGVGRGERGLATAELVIVMPLLLLVLGLGVIGGRLANADQAVQSAAWSAARAASVQRDPASADQAGRTAALASLLSSGLACQHPTVLVMSSAAGDVDRVMISCTVPLAASGVPGVGLDKVISATAGAPVDQFRETSP